MEGQSIWEYKPLVDFPLIGTPYVLEWDSPIYGYARGGIPRAHLALFAGADGVDTVGELTVFKSSVPSNANDTVQQVKGSLFSGAGSGVVHGLKTSAVITATGVAPTCSADGVITFNGDCWDIYTHQGGELWAYWPGINVGETTELDASGNARHITGITTTTIENRTDGAGTNYANEFGYCDAQNLLKNLPVSIANIDVTGPDDDGFYSIIKTNAVSAALMLGIINADGTGQGQASSMTVRLTLRALPGNTATAINVVHTYTGTHVSNIISGPGTIVSTYRPMVEGLSETEDTIVEVTKEAWPVGTNHSFLIYAGTTAAGAIGDGVKVKDIQTYESESSTDFTSRLRTPFARRPLIKSPVGVGTVALIGDSMINAAAEVLRLLHPQTTFLSQGIGGQASSEVTARFYADTVGAGATSAILFVGHNDINGGLSSSDIQTEIVSCAEIARANNLELYLCEISPMGTFSGWTAAKQTEIESFNTWVQAYGNTNGHTVIPIYQMMSIPGTPNLRAEFAFGGDGLHYNDLGDDYEGELFAGALRDSTASSTMDVVGNSNVILGPLRCDLVQISGIDITDSIVKAPLGPEFQVIPEWTNEAEVNLATFTSTANTFIGNALAIYNPVPDDPIAVQAYVDKLASAPPIYPEFGPTWNDAGTWDDTTLWTE